LYFSFHLKKNLTLYLRYALLSILIAVIFYYLYLNNTSNGQLINSTKRLTEYMMDDLMAISHTKLDWKPLNNTNPHSKWCPSANCHNSPLCEPCKQRFILLLATARSGSTTLLKMFNLLPNVRLSGENNNELFIASKVESNLHIKNHNILDPSYEEQSAAWIHNNVPDGAMGCVIQKVLSTINPPPHWVIKSKRVSVKIYDKDTILGAKMVRFHGGTWSSKEAANFLKRNFPCSRVVINIRSDLDSQISSWVNAFQITNEERKNSRKKDLVKANTFLMNMAEELGHDMAQGIDMVEWSDDGGLHILNDLLLWMGFQGCTFKKLLHENHDGFGGDDTYMNLGEKCVSP